MHLIWFSTMGNANGMEAVRLGPDGVPIDPPLFGVPYTPQQLKEFKAIHARKQAAQKAAAEKVKWRHDEINAVKGKKWKHLKCGSLMVSSGRITSIEYEITELDDTTYAVTRSCNIEDWGEYVSLICFVEWHERNLPFTPSPNFKRPIWTETVLQTKTKIIKPLTETEQKFKAMHEETKKLTDKLDEATKQQQQDTQNTKNLTKTIDELRIQLQQQQQIILRMVAASNTRQ